MFSVGDTVCYGTQGICKITNISDMEILNIKKQYYILTPIYDNRATIYLPTDNDNLINNMRKILNAKDIVALIDKATTHPMKWIADDLERKEKCVSILKSGDRYELLRLVKMLYLRREELKTTKKHFHILDERYLREAERLLYDEISYVLEIERNQVPAYILNRLK